MNNALIDTLLLVYGGLFPIVNPVGSAPLFLGLTQFCTDKQRNALAGSVAINSFFLLLARCSWVRMCWSSSASACRSCA